MKKPTYYIPIRISGLSEGEHHLLYRLKPGELELPDEFDSEISIEVTLDKTQSHVLAHFSVDAVAHYQCDRCLAPLTVTVHANDTVVITYSAYEARQLDEENIRLIHPSDPVFELAPDVRDSILVQIPMRKICGTDLDGNSLCDPAVSSRIASDQEEDSIDPRWVQLQSLRK
jgi:uncharacterized protein